MRALAASRACKKEQKEWSAVGCLPWRGSQRQLGTTQLMHQSVQAPCTSQRKGGGDISAGCITTAVGAELRGRLDTHPDAAVCNLCVHDGSKGLAQAAQLVGADAVDEAGRQLQ